MEIISRQDAIKRGLKKYFTGIPCKNGHISERYLQSSACELCIRGNIPNTDEQRSQRQQIAADRLKLEQEKIKLAAERTRINAERLKLSRARREEMTLAANARSRLIKIKQSVYHSDIEALRNFAYLLAISRQPSLRFQDIACPHLSPGIVGGGVGLYTLACFAEDEPAIVEFNRQLLAGHPVDMAAIIAERDRRLGKLIEDDLAKINKSWPPDNNR